MSPMGLNYITLLETLTGEIRGKNKCMRSLFCFLRKQYQIQETVYFAESTFMVKTKLHVFLEAKSATTTTTNRQKKENDPFSKPC